MIKKQATPAGSIRSYVPLNQHQISLSHDSNLDVVSGIAKLIE